jgi:hypothetical protein
MLCGQTILESTHVTVRLEPVQAVHPAQFHVQVLAMRMWTIFMKGIVLTLKEHKVLAVTLLQEFKMVPLLYVVQ